MGPRQCGGTGQLIGSGLRQWGLPAAETALEPPGGCGRAAEGQAQGERPDAPLTRPASLCAMPRRHPSTDRASAAFLADAVAPTPHSTTPSPPGYARSRDFFRARTATITDQRTHDPAGYGHRPRHAPPQHRGARGEFSVGTLCPVAPTAPELRFRHSGVWSCTPCTRALTGPVPVATLRMKAVSQM